MPTARAAGNRTGPNSTIAGMPSRKLPRTTNATADVMRKPTLPPGIATMKSVRMREKPDCVRAQAIAVAQPIIMSIVPDSEAVSIRMGIKRDHLKLRYNSKPTTKVYTTPMVDTSVAVATPSTTADRMTNRSAMAGNANKNARAISARVARTTFVTSSRRLFAQTTAANAIAPTIAGTNPLVNSEAIETPVTEPIVISTTLGGIVSDIAAEVPSIETNSPSSEPLFLISGKRAGATAAMSATFEPEIPDTR